MSKDDVGCKLTSVYKHKERKPKKPHYIPRPWGKPYNYKCFQCPFTCMEKSHLYNHMKYSLCKNSLSLLIESDWPYKKGNLLHPELRLLHAAETSRLHGDEQETCNSSATSGGSVEPDFIITDVFSLKNHVMKSREMASPDLDAKPKHCKVPKKCLTSSGILMEQWKLVANGQRRNTPEVSSPCTDSNIIPCYPPPAYSDYHEPQGLNLSLLGINYPLNPSLFSYLSPTMANSTTTHQHLAQLPFLASTAQLMHPHASHFQPLQSPERSAFLPRFYYPLLFEHTFGSTESKMPSSKPEAQQLMGSVMPTPPQAKPPSEPTKPGLLKVPVLKTGFPWSKGVREEPASELSHPAVLGQEEEEKWLCQEKESNPALGLSSLLLPSVSDGLDHGSCKQSRPQETSDTMTDSEATNVLIGELSKTLEEYQEVEKKLSDLAKEDTPGQKELRDQLVKIRRELYHIHEALEKATKPHEGPLDLSVKRSSEGLEKVQQAKKEPCNMSLGSEKLHIKDQGALKCTAPGEAGDGGELPKCLLEAENKTIDLLIKMSRSESLRASSSEAHLGAVIKAEVLPLTMPLELRSVMEPYYSRTTKCEADSSVLLCSDGRSSTSQGPQLPVPSEDVPLGCRAMQHSLSCSLPSETDTGCVHSPLHADP
uniref:Zinc finger protein 750-like zinc finger domain-containing protein n=1 Tax=Melopsittacus undulatus TaxID=13146 RepID=A0A8C6J1K9_MELUD